MTKPMVATLALQEIQRGRWSLQTRVDDVLPNLLPGHGQITLEQLLSHTSGVPDYDTVLFASATTPQALLRVMNRQYRPRELVAAALTQPWGAAPGTTFAYSNTNYVVVGLMLERLNRTSISRLLERRVFGPAQMTSTSFRASMGWGQRAHLTPYALYERPVNLDRTSVSVFWAAGAVESTPRDLNRFWRALFAGELISGDLVNQMLLARSSDLAYGLGVYAVAGPCPGPDGKPQLMYGHDGAGLGTQTLAFTSRDGRTQASIIWTGRNLVSTETADALAAIRFVRDAMAVDCPGAAIPRRGDAGRQRSDRTIDDGVTQLLERVTRLPGR